MVDTVHPSPECGVYESVGFQPGNIGKKLLHHAGSWSKVMGVGSKNAQPEYRIGIVGTDHNTRAHGAACQALDDVDICDVSDAVLHRYGEEFAVQRRHHSLEDMLPAEQLAFVVVFTGGAGQPHRIPPENRAGLRTWESWGAKDSDEHRHRV